MGQQVMREQHGLSALQMRVAGQVHLARRIGTLQQHLLQADDALRDHEEFATEPEAHIGRRLVDHV